MVLGVAALALALVITIAARAFHFGSLDYGGPAPAGPLLDHPDQVGIPGLRTVDIPADHGTTLRGWYIPAQNRSAVIVTSGTNANRADMLAEVRILAAAGFGVLAFDWPGTGRSDGRIDWGDGAVTALSHAVDWVQRLPDVDPGRVGALGFSAGAMATVRLASGDSRLRAVALTGADPGTDTSAHWLHWAHDPLRTLPNEWAARRYGWPAGVVRPVDLVGRIAPRPVLLIGGSLDTAADARKLAQLCAAAGEPKECWVVPGATHGGYASAAPTEYARRVSDFFVRGLTAP
jgi:dipeptidyl aminopeptidase/acylaminoacyl peptidase